MIFPATEYAKSVHKYENLKPASENFDFFDMKGGGSATSSPHSTMTNTPISNPQPNLYDKIQTPSPSLSNFNAGVVMRRRFTSENDPQMEVDDEDPSSSSAVPRVGRAFYDYEAIEQDELSFKRGSVVEILNKNGVEQGWIYARIGEKEGMIPENYVRLVGRKMTEIKGKEITKYPDKVGTGAFSNVFKGMWKGKEVALKQPIISGKINIVEAIKQEALIYARLHHENIVSFYGICFEIPCLVLELCNGGTLFDLNRKLIYSIPIRVVNWTMQIAKGMEHLHKRDSDQVLIHADLKSGNILIQEEPCLCDHVEKNPREMSSENFKNGICVTCKKTGLDYVTLKLTDFGQSRTENSDRTSISGSIPWMAPEVVRLESQSSKASDVYSFGVVMWELVTNQKPFYQIGGNAVWIAVCRNQKPTIPEDCPVSLSDIMKECWEQETEARPSFTKIIADLVQAQIYADSRKKLDYKDSKKIKMREDDIEQFKREWQFLRNKNIQNTLLVKEKEAPKVATRHRAKITKNQISGPTGFQHVVRVRDNLKDAKQNPNDKSWQCQIEFLASNSTLPRNYKHSTQSANNMQFLPSHHSNGTHSSYLQDSLKNGQPMPKIVRHTPTLPSIFNKPPSPINSHGIKRNNENEDYNNDHLNPMHFAPRLKAAKSNPELAGPSSLLAGKNSRIRPIPLNRSNATRIRNMEPYSHSKAISVIDTRKDTISDLAESPPGPIFRDNQRGRNQSESSLGFNPNSTTSRASSVRANKGKSTFYVDEDEIVDPTLSFNSQGTPTTKKRGIGSLLKIFSSAKSTPTSETEPSIESNIMLCDRPPLPACHHPNHANDPISNKTHLCALTDIELPCQEALRPEPEIHGVISLTKPTVEIHSRKFVKANDDPQKKRRANGNLATAHVSSKTTVPSKVIDKMRQSTSVSEADEQLQSSNEALAEETTSDETIQVIEYEPIRISGAHSFGDLCPVGIDLILTENLHQRSRSSDAQPAEPQEPEYTETDWESGPITNKAYVSLNPNNANSVKVTTAILLNGNGVDLSQPPKFPSPPIPPSRCRPSNLGYLPPPLPTESSVNWRSNNLQSPSSDSQTNTSPHRRRNILNTEVRGLNTPQSSTSQTPDSIELYEETTLPLMNPNYKSQMERHRDDIYMALPSQPAPPPPKQQFNQVPKFLPKTTAQFRKVSPRPPNF